MPASVSPLDYNREDIKTLGGPTPTAVKAGLIDLTEEDDVVEQPARRTRMSRRRTIPTDFLGRPSNQQQGGQKRGRDDTSYEPEPTIAWGEFRKALEVQTLFVVQCAEAVAYMKKIQSIQNSTAWYPPYGEDGPQWTTNNKGNYDFSSNVKQGGTSGGECSGYNLTSTLNNEYVPMLKKTDDNEVEYYHRIRKKALEYCLAVYASHLASTVPSVAMLTSTSMANMKINPACFMAARNYVELEESTKNSGCTPGQLRAWDFHIHKEALHLLATIGIAECGYFNPQQLVNRVLANRHVQSSTVADWISKYENDRDVPTKHPGSTYDINAKPGLVVGIELVEDSQEDHESQEDEDELKEAGSDIVSGDAALFKMFETGHKKTKLFPSEFLKDFIHWVPT